MTENTVDALNRELNDSLNSEDEWVCVDDIKFSLSNVLTYGYKPEENACVIFIKTRFEQETVELLYSQEFLDFLDNYFKVRSF